MKLSLLFAAIAAASPVEIIVEQKCTKNYSKLTLSFVSRANKLHPLLRVFVSLIRTRGSLLTVFSTVFVTRRLLQRRMLLPVPSGTAWRLQGKMA
jgi:hypothetical protein